MLVNSLLGLAAAALLGFSEIPGSYEMVITGRLLVGINCGEYWIGAGFINRRLWFCALLQSMCCVLE